MGKKRLQSGGSIPEKWSPKGKRIGFYLRTFSVGGSIIDISGFRFDDLEKVYARLGPQCIMRWREAGILPETIIFCFSDPLSLRQFNDCRKAIDSIIGADLRQIARDLGFKVTKGKRWLFNNAMEFCSVTLVDFYLRYDLKDFPLEDTIRWCVHEMYTSNGSWALQRSAGYKYPHTQVAGWMRSGFTHEQVSELMRLGFRFTHPEEAVSRWRMYSKRGYSWKEFLISRDLISQFQGESDMSP